MKLIVAPLPRFINSPCCQVAGHLTNFKGEDYGTNMGDSIAIDGVDKGIYPWEENQKLQSTLPQHNDQHEW